MRLLILFALACASCLSCYCQSSPTYDTKETHALNKVAEKWQRYWNSHDMDSFATLFAPDVDFVTKSGIWFKGKEETMNHHRKNHTSIFKTSTWATDSVVIKYVKP